MPAEKVVGTSNILFMMVDQMRADYMGCAGNPWIQTPGLDRLAAEGTRFSQCVTPVPVCMAARHSFMTGLRCATHGRSANNVLNPDPLHYTLMQLLGFVGLSYPSDRQDAFSSGSAPPWIPPDGIDGGDSGLSARR